MENIKQSGTGITTEQPLLTFQVITDTHVTADPEHVHNRNLREALRQITELAPQSGGVMHAGDVTDHGFPEEYAEFRRIWEEHQSGLPELTMTTGNHDVGLGIWEERIERFLSETGTPGMYHDRWIGGCHFIFLGTERNLKDYCTLSETQLQWLSDKLKEEAKPERPTFVFLHQPLLNTVAGSYEHQHWNGVTEDDELRKVLEGHPEAILFTGHTHWELSSPNILFYREAKLPVMFGAASVAYLWTDEDEHKDGSQGFFVEVYDNRVVVAGRDFAKGEWMDEARFEIRYPRRTV